MLGIYDSPPLRFFLCIHSGLWSVIAKLPFFLNQISFIPKRKFARLGGDIIRGGPSKPRDRGQAGTASKASDTASLRTRESETAADAPRGGQKQQQRDSAAERTLTSVFCAGRVRGNSEDKQQAGVFCPPSELASLYRGETAVCAGSTMRSETASCAGSQSQRKTASCAGWSCTIMRSKKGEPLARSVVLWAGGWDNIHANCDSCYSACSYNAAFAVRNLRWVHAPVCI